MLMKKNEEKCLLSVIGSNSQKLVDNQTLVAHWNFNKIPNEQPAFKCQPAFGSHSQLLTNNFFFIFPHAFYMSLLCTRWKRYFFHHFRMFFIVFNHVNACASMYSLVKVHNSQSLSNFITMLRYYFITSVCVWV